jgi:hypothetical protein
MHLCQCITIMLTSLPVLYHDYSVNRAHSFQIIPGMFFVSSSSLISGQKSGVGGWSCKTFRRIIQNSMYVKAMSWRIWG